MGSYKVAKECICGYRSRDVSSFRRHSNSCRKHLVTPDISANGGNNGYTAIPPSVIPFNTPTPHNARECSTPKRTYEHPTPTSRPENLDYALLKYLVQHVENMDRRIAELEREVQR